jgi:hypothetical protein
VRRVIVPSESPPAERVGCDLLPSDPAPARVATWADQMLAGCLAGWPCDELSLATRLSADCRAGTCTAPRADVDEDGRVACRVIARTRDQSPCPTERGWLDPLDEDGIRRPVLEPSADGRAAERVCEVHQLEGPAFASCRTTLGCEDCEPGWCFTEVAELLAWQQCPPDLETGALRFVLGADSARNARVEIDCWHSSA